MIMSRSKTELRFIEMSRTEKYANRLRNANFTEAFIVQGEAFADYLVGNISHKDYCVLYSWCECIMNHVHVKSPM